MQYTAYKIGGCFCICLTMAAAIFLLPAQPSAHAAPPVRPSSGDGNPPTVESGATGWPALTDEQMDASITTLKRFAAETSKQLERPLAMFETEYFLFYSDLKEDEAQKWAGLLDKMYGRLSEMFGLAKGINIWRGKALVFVFSSELHYLRYEREMAHTDPTGTAGMCQCATNGLVNIAFYRQPNELEFAHILVHESVHGFIHRYRSPARVASWANEGLAETIGDDLVPQPARVSRSRVCARSTINLHRGVGDLFTAEHIAGWQYPVAEMMCTFMVQSDKKKYVEFINGIKDGQSADDSLTKNFKASNDRVVAGLIRWLGK